MMTMTTVGYGDVVPLTDIELVVGTLYMVAGGVLWAYVIGSLTRWVVNLN